MFCTACKQNRIENEQPCSYCGAPSPLVSGAHYQHSLSGNAGTTTSGSTFAAASGQLDFPVPQLSFDQPSAFVLSPPSNVASSTNEANYAQFSTAAQPQQQALVPYQSPLPMQVGEQQTQTTMSLHLIPHQMVEHLLPAHLPQPETVSIPPFYDKPQSIVPRYRVISGMLSVLIVTLLLCGGIGYYAKASGNLDRVVHLFNPAPPPPARVRTTPAPSVGTPPVNFAESGEAHDTVPSASTTAHVTITNDSIVPVQEENDFKINQQFYLICSLQNPDPKGVLTFKWFTGNQLYQVITYQLSPDPKDQNKIVVTLLPKQEQQPEKLNKGGISTISITMKYQQPSQGRVEIEWNNKLAQKRFFIVR